MRQAYSMIAKSAVVFLSPCDSIHLTRWISWLLSLFCLFVNCFVSLLSLLFAFTYLHRGFEMPSTERGFFACHLTITSCCFLLSSLLSLSPSPTGFLVLFFFSRLFFLHHVY
jgi:hypothetical protein